MQYLVLGKQQKKLESSSSGEKQKEITENLKSEVIISKFTKANGIQDFKILLRPDAIRNIILYDEINICNPKLCSFLK